MNRTGLLRLVWVLVALVAVLAPAGAARAQGEQDGAGGSAAGVGGGGGVTGTGEVDLRITQFGLGNRPRPGDWVAVRVEVLNRSDKLRNTIIRLTIPDADGDQALIERVIVPDPGQRRFVWLYARLPFNTGTGTMFELSAFEAIERPGEGGQMRSVAGRRIGGAAVQVGRVAPGMVFPHTGLIGVVGSRAAGVEQYTIAAQGADSTPTGHEKIEVVAGLTPADIPDRWQGLMPLDALVWTASGTEGEPRDLTESQAEALREWVMRGGHLVIVLPPVGQGWIGRRDHLLADLMPAVAVRSLQGTPLEPYRALLRRTPDSPLPVAAVVNALDPEPGATQFEAARVLAGPEGEGIVVRRLVGTGAVTVIGLDLTSRALASSGGVDGDVFWNRVLGKRIEMPPREDAASRQQSRFTNVGGHRPPRWFDRDIAAEIAKSKPAAAGLLLAFFVFLLYWLGAGPVGYFILRKRGYKHHSWILFLGMAGVFTAVAWGGATMLKEREAQASHLTFLDHVYGQPNQRARVWMNLLLPEYGEQRVSIGDPKVARTGSVEWRHALTPWEAPSGGIGLPWGAFPDARGYVVDARSPDTITAPSRATVRQFQADWAGPPEWKMPAPVPPDASGPVRLGTELQLRKTDNPEPGQRWWRLYGTLTHDLPGELHDVVVVVVLRQGFLGTTPSAALVRDVFTANLPSPWAPGQPLDLGLVTAPTTSSRLTAQAYFGDQLLGRVGSGLMQEEESTTVQSRDSVNRLTALAFYSMLEPPRISTNQLVQNESVLARRQAAHAWDLGRWFTQPCIILVGHLPDQESPVPLFVDGQRVATKGRTVVRWIYPLPDDPPQPDRRGGE